jgi:hypothetical protein
MYRIAVVILVIVFFLFAYAYISKPDGLVVNENGKVEGLVNDVRALLQGDKFWERQLKLANDGYNRSLEPQIPSSSEMQKLYQKLAEDEKALNEKMKPLYSREEQMAILFRMKADSLERAGKWRTIDEAQVEENTRESEKYKNIIPKIESKLKIPKQQSLTKPDSSRSPAGPK